MAIDFLQKYLPREYRKNKLLIKWNRLQYGNIPASIDASAAMRNDMTTEGPAVSLATCPATT